MNPGGKSSDQYRGAGAETGAGLEAGSPAAVVVLVAAAPACEGR